MNFNVTKVLPGIIAAMAFCLVSVCFAGDTDHPETHPVNFSELLPFAKRPIQDDLIYFMVTDRFSNGDPGNDRGGIDGDRLAHGFDPSDEKFYHGGDLKGVTAKLDYLADMGVTAIWLTPIFKNKWVQENYGWLTASYHGYWITDFTRVDPHLGSDDDLRELIAEAHKRNIKIIFDIVINHTADIIKYRQCNDPEYQGKDKEGAGAACVYRSSDTYPYTSKGMASGTPINAGFKGHEKANQTDANFSTLRDPSYAYTPFIPDSEKEIKIPAWLNNPIYYHNRGEIVYEGEAFYFGDFYGLDDTFTEHPDVVRGMIDIYQYWIREYGIDGFRIDTAGHVDVSFWARFVPAIQKHANEHGRPEFFMFGEVINSVMNKRSYVTSGKLPAILDFDFKHSVVEYVANSGSAKGFASQFLDTDDYFIDHDSSAYKLPTFLSNHDDCRLGVHMKKADTAADDATLMDRTRLAQAIMYFSRGIPILYYGDEQGFMGEPGFHECREDMLASQVDVFNDNDLLGTDQTTADVNFDTQHPIYRYLKQLGSTYRHHPALRNGDQHIRFAEEGKGIIAWSRIDPLERVEYMVVFNNSKTRKSAAIPVFSPTTSWTHISGSKQDWRAISSFVEVNIPPLDYLVLKADQKIPLAEDPLPFSFKSPQNGDTLQCGGFVEVDLKKNVLTHVKFEIKRGESEWEPLGTDRNYPYRILLDTSAYAAGERLSLKASTVAYTSAPQSTTIDFVIDSTNRNCE